MVSPHTWYNDWWHLSVFGQYQRGNEEIWPTDLPSFALEFNPNPSGAHVLVWPQKLPGICKMLFPCMQAISCLWECFMSTWSGRRTSKLNLPTATDVRTKPIRFTDAAQKNGSVTFHPGLGTTSLVLRFRLLCAVQRIQTAPKLRFPSRHIVYESAGRNSWPTFKGQWLNGSGETVLANKQTPMILNGADGAVSVTWVHVRCKKISAMSLNEAHHRCSPIRTAGTDNVEQFIRDVLQKETDVFCARKLGTGKINAPMPRDSTSPTPLFDKGMTTEAPHWCSVTSGKKSNLFLTFIIWWWRCVTDTSPPGHKSCWWTAPFCTNCRSN